MKKTQIVMSIGIFLATTANAESHSKSFPQGSPHEAVITIQAGNQKHSFGRKELLKNPETTHIEIKNPPAALGKTFQFDAIPAWALFKDLKFSEDSTLVFSCTDGFSAPISRERLLNQDPSRSIAFVAIENPRHPWPKLKDGISSGPYFLIWKNPELSSIGAEEWPYRLTGFEVKPPLKDLYPAIFPDPKLPESDTVKIGFKLFTKNCFTCHTLNRQGAAQLGPDLNLPLNPTEYLTREALRKLIRDPQSLRFWPQAKMTGFAATALSDAEIEKILSYLEHMKGRRP